jgi:opacity protein-like surface antigen
MKNSKKIALGIVSTTAGLVSAGSIYAADAWTGFNVYGGVSYGKLESKEHTQGGALDCNCLLADFSGTQNKSKVTGDLGLGYDAKVGDKFLVGVFADVNLANLTTKSSNSWGNNSNYTMTTSTKVKDAYSLGAKLGYLLSDNDLIYVSGGASRAKVSTKFSQDNGNEVVGSVSKTKTGGFVGLGLEHKLNENLSIVGDYRKTTYGKVDVANTSNSNSAAISNRASVKTENVSLNLKYKF